MRRIMLAVAIGLLGLPGCGTDPPTPPPLTPSPSATPSAPTAPELPPEAQGSSRKAAKAFVEYYIEVLNAASANGDTSELRILAHRDCEVCNNFVNFIDKVYAAGGHLKGDGWLTQRTRILGDGPERSMAVVAVVAVSPQEVVRAKGAKAEQFAGSPRQRKVFSLSGVTGQWRVTDIETQQ